MKAAHVNEAALRRATGYPLDPVFEIDNDIALLELSEPVPASRPSLPLGSRELTLLWPKGGLYLYGYNWAGTKGDLRYVQSSGLLPEALGLEGAEAKAFLEAIKAELSAGIGHLTADGRSPCPGTSGGPIVAKTNGVDTVVGVVVRQGSKTCEPPAEDLGAMPAGLGTLGTKRQVSVSYHHDWLVRTLSEIETAK
ncbi:MAG: trypsin-like serine protease [Proteobacteria bacterium]|nr:MAG: trypsin-like serine protease [Pseudomonadota bacterium]